MNFSSNELAWTSCLFLGAVFAASGLLKLRHFVRFRDSLASMELVPRTWTYPLVWCLIALELVLAISLLTAPGTRWTGALVVGLLGVFIAVLAWHRWRGHREISCGCFADFDHKTRTVNLILRNVLLVVMALPLVWIGRVELPDWGVSDWLLAGLTLVGLGIAWKGLVVVGEILDLRKLELRTD